jgi:hypothetical protein
MDDAPSFHVPLDAVCFWFNHWRKPTIIWLFVNAFDIYIQWTTRVFIVT